MSNIRELSQLASVIVVSNDTKNVGIGSTIPSSKLSVSGDAYISGIVTASGGFNLGISSAGSIITSGPITNLNFVGVGNTFLVNGTEIDISISGGGGGSSSVTISPTPPLNPSEGNLWYNSELGRIFIYYVDGSSSQWVDAAPFNNPLDPDRSSIRTVYSYTPTGIQTTFSASYTTGYLDVYHNGIHLVPETDFIAISGIDFSLVNAANNGDSVVAIGYTSINLTAVTLSEDTTPSLGGDLNLSNYNITGNGNINIVGDITATGMNVGVITASNYVSLSDKNLKENIETIDNALNTVNDLRGVRFQWKEDKRPSYGVIAQELEQIVPELVTDTNPKTVNYNGIIGILIEGMKEQNLLIENLQNKIIYMENTLGISSSR